uniref:Uncharacterized protein n=1 Tax=Trichogramma kaykai TaxID=54128 RepID=A0ABD2XV32_9HYME
MEKKSTKAYFSQCICAAAPCRWRTVYTKNINGFERATLQSRSSTCSLVREIHADQEKHTRIYYNGAKTRKL